MPNFLQTHLPDWSKYLEVSIRSSLISKLFFYYVDDLQIISTYIMLKPKTTLTLEYAGRVPGGFKALEGNKQSRLLDGGCKVVDTK